MSEKPQIPPTFCALPWTHLFGDEKGDLFPCCFSHDHPILSDDGKPMRIDEPDAVEKARNSKFMKRMRVGMLNGEKPDVCRNCFRTEELGADSYRQSSNKWVENSIPQMIAATEPDGTIPPMYRFFDLRLGNLCNLRCRMCSPHSTKLLIEDFREIYSKAQDDAELAAYKNVDWYTKPELWDVLAKHAPQLERLHFAGGEPLIIPEAFDFLRRIVKMGLSKNITLTYNTNLTVIPPQAYELWPHFKNVFLTISLDGYDAVNHYIRYPARWADLDKNMRTIENDHKTLNVGSASIHATVQVYNVMRLNEMFDYLFKNFRFVSPYPYIDMVSGKSFLDIQILPRLLKYKAAWRIMRIIARIEKQAPGDSAAKEFVARLQSVITYMNEGHHPEMIPEFKRVTEIYDRRRSERLSDVLPELAPLMLAPHAGPLEKFRAYFLPAA